MQLSNFRPLLYSEYAIYMVIHDYLHNLAKFRMRSSPPHFSESSIYLRNTWVKSYPQTSRSAANDPDVESSRILNRFAPRPRVLIFRFLEPISIVAELSSGVGVRFFSNSGVFSGSSKNLCKVNNH